MQLFPLRTLSVVNHRFVSVIYMILVYMFMCMTYKQLVTLGLALSGWHFTRLAVENVVYGGKVRIQHPSACSNQSLSLLGIFHIAEPDSALTAVKSALCLWKRNGP